MKVWQGALRSMIKTRNKYLVFDRPICSVKYAAKRIIVALLGLYYGLLYQLYCPVPCKTRRYNVALCSMFRDEGFYLKEWIEYHKIVGVEHFYLYNNFSEDNYLEVLAPYIEEGSVTLIDWPQPQGQMAAYADCLKRFGDEAQWVGFIDLDEYVVPNSTYTIGDFLRRFEKNRPVVIMNWRYFGSSGLIERDLNGFIIEDFTLCWSQYSDIGKCFFNTSYEYDPTHKKNKYMHVMWGRYNGRALPPVNVFNKVCLYGINPATSGDMPIQINHYVVKSYGEYIGKKAKRGGGVHKDGFHTTEYFWNHERRCDSVDYHALKYLVQLKLRMKNPYASSNEETSGSRETV